MMGQTSASASLDHANCVASVQERSNSQTETQQQKCRQRQYQQWEARVYMLPATISWKRQLRWHAKVLIGASTPAYKSS